MKHPLYDLVYQLKYKDGFKFWLSHELGQLTLVININMPDNYRPEQMFSIGHLMPVPEHSPDWPRWLIDQIGLVEEHERCEAFQLGSERPFAPVHGPGGNLYPLSQHCLNS